MSIWLWIAAVFFVISLFFLGEPIAWLFIGLELLFCVVHVLKSNSGRE